MDQSIVTNCCKTLSTSIEAFKTWLLVGTSCSWEVRFIIQKREAQILSNDLQDLLQGSYGSYGGERTFIEYAKLPNAPAVVAIKA